MNFFTLILFLFLKKFLYSYKNIKINNINKYSSYKFKIYHNDQYNSEYDKYIIIKHDNEYNNQNKNSSFYLPGFFEVFPELKIDFKNYEFKFKKCKKNDDCEKPEMCCDNPLKKNDKFCCSGAYVGKRVPEYAF
jgi:hypothetical protein